LYFEEVAKGMLNC